MRGIHAGLLWSGLLHLGVVLAAAGLPDRSPPVQVADPVLRLTVMTARVPVMPVPDSPRPRPVESAPQPVEPPLPVVVPPKPVPVVRKAPPPVVSRATIPLVRPVDTAPQPEVVDSPPAGPTIQALPVSADVRRSYLRALRERIQQQKHFPERARRRGVEGEVLVAFLVDATGRIGSLRIERSSGSRILDRAALETVRRVSAFRPPPPELGQAGLELAIPIAFALGS